MADDSLPPLVTRQTTTPAPLEGQDVPTGEGMQAQYGASFMGTLGVSLAAHTQSGGATIPHDEAVKTMKSNGYDASVLPDGEVSQGYLDAVMGQQSQIARDRDMAARAHLGGATQFVSSFAGSMSDPLFLALGPVGKLLQGARAVAGLGEAAEGATLAVRAVKGAAEGGAIIGGYETAQKFAGTGQGDRDITTMQIVHDATIGALLGGTLGAAFGARPTPASDQAIDSILKEEGGKTTDTGGRTNFGISQKAHPEVDVDNLTVSQARQIYKTEYWDKIGGDSLPANMQMTALDAAVNQGVGKASLWLKEANGDPLKFNALRRADYEKLAAENTAVYGKYLNGWLARLNRVSLKSINPFFPAQGGAAESVLAQKAENVSRGQIGPASRVESGLETPAPEGITPAGTEAAQGSTLDQLGRMKTPILTNYGGTMPVSLGEQMSRMRARGYDTDVVRENAAKTAVLQASNDSVVNVDPLLPKPSTEATDLSAAIPKSGSIIAQEPASAAMLERVNGQASAKAPPQTEGSIVSPETAQLKQQSTDAIAEAEHAHTMANGVPVEGEVEPESALKTALASDDEAIANESTLAKAIDAAVRCSVIKGA